MSWEILCRADKPMEGSVVRMSNHLELLDRLREEKHPKFLKKGNRGMPVKPISRFVAESKTSKGG